MTTKPEEAKAENQLAAFIDRILRLKTEADDIASDIKEIYQEAHANGFNKTRLGEVVTHLRKVEKDATGEAEKAALRDLYLDAYYRAKGLSHAYAREEEPEHDAETGEIIEPQSPQPAAQTVLDGGPVFTSPAESEAVAISAPIQPETANEAGDDLVTSPVTAADHGEVVNGNDATQHNPGGENEDAADPAVEPFDRRHFDVIENSSEERSNDLEAVTTSAQIVTGEGAHNASVTPFTPKPLRPYCQNPGNKCGGMGRKHCFACEQAHQRAEAGAA